MREAMLRPVTIALMMIFTLPAHAADDTGFDPLAAYGEQIEFEVLRNGDPIGTHRVNFLPLDDGVQVDAEMNLNIRFLGLNVYQFGYRSSSFWQDGRMVELDAFTDDDGDRTRVQARKAGEQLEISGPQGDLTGRLGVYATDHWNPGVIGSSTVVNTITGQLATVQIRNAGVERIETGNGPRMATRHIYSGDLKNVEVWYDSQGRWVRLRFPDKQDGVIDYRCIRCGEERTASR